MAGNAEMCTGHTKHVMLGGLKNLSMFSIIELYYGMENV